MGSNASRHPPSGGSGNGAVALLEANLLVNLAIGGGDIAVPRQVGRYFVVGFGLSTDGLGGSSSDREKGDEGENEGDLHVGDSNCDTA